MERASMVDEEPAAPPGLAEEPPSAPFVLNTLPVPAPVLPKPGFDPETITRDGYAPVSFAEAKNHVGRAAKIVMKNGRTHRGTIHAARPAAIELEQYLGAGSISVEFGAREIDTVFVDAR